MPAPLIPFSLYLDYRRVRPLARQRGFTDFEIISGFRGFTPVDLTLGDTPGVLPAPYAGLTAKLPLTITASQDSLLIVHTELVETLADWQRHTVSWKGQVIGLVQDSGGSPTEVFAYTIRQADAGRGELTVDVGQGAGQGGAPGLFDDFIIRGISLIGGQMRLGYTFP